jgi:hypothetical protein
MNILGRKEKWTMSGIITNARDLKKGVLYKSEIDDTVMTFSHRGRSRIHNGCIYYMYVNDAALPIPLGTIRVLELKLRPVLELDE